MKILKVPIPSKYVICCNRKECETVATDLRRSGISAVAYHAGLLDGDRLGFD